jgi:hypothetical protein
MLFPHPLVALRLTIAQCPKAPEVGKPLNVYDLCEVRWAKETMGPTR